MARIRADIKISHRNRWAIFDSGSRNNYISEDVALDLPSFDLPKPQPVSLGGEVHSVSKCAYLDCEIEGLPIQGHARIIDEIGLDEDGKKIEAIIGALTMQEWGIRLDLEEEKLDLSRYPKEFVEY
jgi:hypothetical protein